MLYNSQSSLYYKHICCQISTSLIDVIFSQNWRRKNVQSLQNKKNYLFLSAYLSFLGYTTDIKTLW